MQYEKKEKDQSFFEDIREKCKHCERMETKAIEAGQTRYEDFYSGMKLAYEGILLKNGYFLDDIYS